MQGLDASNPSELVNFPPKVTVSGTDVRVKEVVLVSMALCLLVCSMCLFFKHWKKNYRDINQLSYYAYEYDKAPDTDIPVGTTASGPQCKPGVSSNTSYAAAALAAAMAQRAAITIYQMPPAPPPPKSPCPPSKLYSRSPELLVKNYRNSQDSAISSSTGCPASAESGRRHSRRQSDILAKRTSTIHQVRRNSLHFLSTDRDLELASSNSNFNQARQQRLSSIISSDEYEEQEEDIIPNAKETTATAAATVLAARESVDSSQVGLHTSPLPKSKMVETSILVCGPPAKENCRVGGSQTATEIVTTV